jgi:ABC-type transport system substrate-binding protein
MGKSFRDQITALELARADLVEVAPEQVHRVSLEGQRLASSEPMELLALVFAHDARTPEEKLLRDALALSVDRGSMRNVLLQGAGQPAGGVLPNWMSGYGFVFATEADLARAHHKRDQVRTVPVWTLGYDADDPLARLLAERIALNARDAGLSVQPTAAATSDSRLMRIPMASPDPWIALGRLPASTGSPARKNAGGSAEDLYKAEQSLLATQLLIPLFHLPVTYAASPALKNWTARPDGIWNLTDAWLGSRQP